MTSNDELRLIYVDQKALLNSGSVVWGAIVQANKLLFNAGTEDHPVLIVYSLDPHFDANPDQLLDIAKTLFGLKGNAPESPEHARFASMITNEMERAMSWVVPQELTDGYEVTASTMMLIRKHLPNNRLERSLMPLLTHPSTPATMVLPSSYWPR
ncbi:hypothetical protein [Rhodoferax saidenbachensis]|uniref:Universal stress protein n=1 Tax=Rhodoferax saidenbachensis TaxID=1484693 RepID=A0ABU1ZMG8_9BURK|nr:hypothetical protein [Rhodoferax saidenbachensis]MDR7306573.1 hypothetical protein [Rhodoferax saidenbachensis]